MRWKVRMSNELVFRCAVYEANVCQKEWRPGLLKHFYLAGLNLLIQIFQFGLFGQESTVYPPG